VGIMSESKPKRPTPKKCPPELRERAVRLVREAHQEDPGLSQTAAHERIGKRLGVHHETLRTWGKQAEVDMGRRAGTTTVDAARIKELERENR
jgi:transposase